MKVVRKKRIGIRIESNWKLLFVIIGLIIVLIFVIYIIVQDRNEIVEVIEGDLCVQDSDCVPSDCCHAIECVIKEKAPDCQSNPIFCTAVCSGPLDCNVGSCGCINNKCLVVSNE